MEKKNRVLSRRKARSSAMQALYQWQYTQDNPEDILPQFSAENLDREYFEDLVCGAIDKRDEIDNLMQAHLDRDISDLNPVELAILRLAIYEFLARLDVPYRVVINEALELAKRYGSDQGYKYVNAVLDAMAPGLRKAEVQGR